MFQVCESNLSPCVCAIIEKNLQLSEYIKPRIQEAATVFGSNTYINSSDHHDATHRLSNHAFSMHDFQRVLFAAVNNAIKSSLVCNIKHVFSTHTLCSNDHTIEHILELYSGHTIIHQHLTCWAETSQTLLLCRCVFQNETHTVLAQPAFLGGRPWRWHPAFCERLWRVCVVSVITERKKV